MKPNPTEAQSYSKNNSTLRNKTEVSCPQHRLFFATEVIPLLTFTGLVVLLSPLHYLDSVFLIWLLI